MTELGRLLRRLLRRLGRVFTATEIEPLVRQLIVAWDAWIESDSWSGPEFDALNDAAEALRAHVERR